MSDAGAVPELTLRRFAEELWRFVPASQVVEFWCKRDKPGPAEELDENGEKRRHKPETRWDFYTLDDLWRFWDRIQTHLLTLNREGWNIHHGLNPRFRRPPKRGRNEDVNGYTALWGDLDWHNVAESAVRESLERNLKELDGQDLHPSVILESGYGLHVYWLLDRLYPADPLTETCPAREACAGLQDFLKIADAISDPARVLRWPDTANWRFIRPDPPRCRIVEATWRRYPLEAFDGFRIDPGRTNEAIERETEESREKAAKMQNARQLQEQLERLGGKAASPSKDPEVERIKLGVDEGERNDAAARLAGHYYGRGWDEGAVLFNLREWNKKNRPPLDDDELYTVVESIGKKESRKVARKEAAAREDAQKRVQADARLEKIKAGPFEGEARAAFAVELADHFAAGFLRRRIPKKVYLEALKEWNGRACTPPLSEEELSVLADERWVKAHVQFIEEQSKETAERQKAAVEKATHEEVEEETDRYFRGREFLPEILAEEIATLHSFLATPKDADGLGTHIYVFQDGAFRRGGEDVVTTEVRAALQHRTKGERVLQVQTNLRISKKIGFEELNPQAKELINVQNGMLNWRTGELLPHHPKYRSTIQIEAPWDPNATCEPIDAFFSQVLAADEVALAHEFLGYLLLPDTSFGKCLVAVGGGGNGKSSYLRLVTGFIGLRNISNYSLHQIAEERFSVAGLLGKLVNVYDELEAKAVENTGIFKQIVTGDAIKAEEKGRAPFYFRPFSRLVFATNQMPTANDRSQAFFDRLIFLQFPNRFRGTKGQVRNYDEYLLGLPGARARLLHHAVDGLRRLTQQGHFTPSATSEAAIEDYRIECNSAYEFVRETCSFEDPTGWISKASLYSAYRVWAIEQGRKPLSSRHFSKVVKDLNVRDVRHGDARGWGGIAWGNGAPPATVADEVKDFGSAASEEIQ